MLPITSDAVRLFLHVLAATVWVGGQLVLGGLVPVVRRAGGETVTAVARRFQLPAWPAWAGLLLTGLWNIPAAHFFDRSDAWEATGMAKIGAFFLGGVGTGLHTPARARGRQAASRGEAR